jgi:hypothetical protein
MVPDASTGFTVVGATRPRKVTVAHDDRGELHHSRLSASDTAVGLFSTPVIRDWGTVFALIKSPSLSTGPMPIAQRGGATLWLSPNVQESSVGHAVDWVNPGEWVLIASHVTTERVWWDVLGWGTGTGSTIDTPNRDHLKDNGLTLLAVDEPLVVAALQFHGRTFGHDELLGFADARTLPNDPWRLWLPTGADHHACSVLGSLNPALSWDAASTRVRKRAVQLTPTTGHSWRSEIKTPIGTSEARLGGGDGFVFVAQRPLQVDTEPMRSLMNTPFPEDDELD